MYTEDSSLIGGPSSVPARWVSAIARRNPEEAAAIVAAYQVACGWAGISADLALAQACDECDWFNHPRWRQERNPAGIGIFSDATAGPQFGSISNGVEAHIALLCCYALPATPNAVRGWGVLESFGFGGFQRDRPRLGDLNGSWAVPGDDYAENIAAIANGVVGMEQQRTVTGEDVVAAGMKHLGDVHERDTWNGDHPVSMLCQADVEDWQTEATGVEAEHFASARASRESAPIQFGEPEIGAQIWMSGPGWSAFDHTGVYAGGGRVLSGLATVQLSDGWLDLPTYAGWRRLAGVTAAAVVPPAPPPVRTAEGNPFGVVPMLHPFSSRWYLLDALGLALPMMGYPRSAETTAPGGRRIQLFERGWYGVQDAPAPWDLVALLPSEMPGAKTGRA